MPFISIDIIWHYLNYTLAPSWYSSSTLISSFWVCDHMVSKYYFCLCVPILHVSIYGAVYRTCVHKCKMILMLMMMMMVVLVVMMVRRMVIIKIFYIWQKFYNFKTLIFFSATFIKSDYTSSMQAIKFGNWEVNNFSFVLDFLEI